jgi:hypothetical protein
VTGNFHGYRLGKKTGQVKIHNDRREIHAYRANFTRQKIAGFENPMISLGTGGKTGWRALCEQKIVGRKMVGKFCEVIYE